MAKKKKKTTELTVVAKLSVIDYPSEKSTIEEHGKFLYASGDSLRMVEAFHEQTLKRVETTNEFLFHVGRSLWMMRIAESEGKVEKGWRRKFMKDGGYTEQVIRKATKMFQGPLADDDTKAIKQIELGDVPSIEEGLEILGEQSEDAQSPQYLIELEAEKEPEVSEDPNAEFDPGEPDDKVETSSTGVSTPKPKAKLIVVRFNKDGEPYPPPIRPTNKQKGDIVCQTVAEQKEKLSEAVKKHRKEIAIREEIHPEQRYSYSRRGISEAVWPAEALYNFSDACANKLWDSQAILMAKLFDLLPLSSANTFDEFGKIQDTIVERDQATASDYEQTDDPPKTPKDRKKLALKVLDNLALEIEACRTLVKQGGLAEPTARMKAHMKAQEKRSAELAADKKAEREKKAAKKTTKKATAKKKPTKKKTAKKTAKKIPKLTVV
jgi:hypothetical protein